MITNCYSTYLYFFVADLLVVEVVGENHSLIKKNYYNTLEILEQIDFIKGEVAFYNKWKPLEVDDLEFQHKDYRGLFWWYNKMLTTIAEKNKQNSKKP